MIVITYFITQLKADKVFENQTRTCKNPKTMKKTLRTMMKLEPEEKWVKYN